MSVNAEKLAMPVLRRPRDRELYVGLFVLMGILAVLGLLYAFTSPSTFRGRYSITAQLPEAGGLRKNDPVQMRGVDIGRVSGFVIQRQTVQVQLEIEGAYQVPANSIAELRTGSLLGDKVLEILPGDSNQMLKRGATIQGRTETTVLSQAGSLAENANEVLGKVDQLLSEETVENLEQTTGELRGLVSELRQSAAGLDRVTSSPDLRRSIAQLDELTQKMDRVAQSADTVFGRVAEGEGSLGKLTRDEALYSNANQAVENLSRAAAEISKLTEDIRKEPKRYFNLSLF